MDNFKRRNPKRTVSSVDGFVRRPPVGRTNLDFSQASKKSLNAKDGFSAPDGFIARTPGSKIPDGTATGRKAVRGRDLDLSLPDSTKQRNLRTKKGRAKLFAKKSMKTAGTFTVVLAGFLIGLAYLRATQVFQGGANALGLNCDVNPQELKKEGDGRVNILLLGKGGPGHDGADLTDTLMVASLDACQKEVGLVSIPRDLYVTTEGGSSTKINSVYAFAKERARYVGQNSKQAEKTGIKATERVVEEVTGMPIHYYAMVDFKAFRKAIDTVGGVDVNVKEQLYDPTVAWENNNNPVIAEKGQQHFGGQRALLYARSRFGSERGDFDRAERQREIMLALKDKVFTLGTFGNPVKMTQLFDAFGSHVQTDLSIDNLLKLYEIAGDINNKKVQSLSLVDPPNDYVTTSNLGGLSVVIPKAGVNNYDAIHTFLRTKLRDGFLKKENAAVAVLNGTSTPGLAAQYAKTLKNYGYRISKAGDAPNKGVAETQIIDLRQKDNKYTRRYLELRFNTKATTDVPDGISTENLDFVIILGANETGN